MPRWAALTAVCALAAFAVALLIARAVRPAARPAPAAVAAVRFDGSPAALRLTPRSRVVRREPHARRRARRRTPRAAPAPAQPAGPPPAVSAPAAPPPAPAQVPRSSSDSSGTGSSQPRRRSVSHGSGTITIG